MFDAMGWWMDGYGCGRVGGGRLEDYEVGGVRAD